MADSTPISPLAEADPYSLDEEFERIDAKLAAGLPETISDDDLKPVIRKLRLQRHQFALDEAQGKRAGRRKAETKATISADDLDI